MVKTSRSNATGTGAIPGQRAKIPHASRAKTQNIKRKHCCNKFNKDFKNGPHLKKIKEKNVLRCQQELWMFGEPYLLTL